jgi:hypothetical protein
MRDCMGKGMSGNSVKLEKGGEYQKKRECLPRVPRIVSQPRDEISWKGSIRM